MTVQVDNLIALTCICGLIYMTICFLKNRRLIQQLVFMIDKFEKFGKSDNLKETDRQANFYSKIFIFYGILGNIVYMIMPYLNMQKCHDKKVAGGDDGVPCGLVVRWQLPLTFDYSPLFEIVIVYQFFTCTMVSLIILTFTMLLCGFLMHVTNQLNYLRSIIGSLQNVEEEKLEENIIFCIKYHIDIIEYSDLINEAFCEMMLVHLTLTSLIISVLCFEILMVDDLTDSLRFFLHLNGWFVILLLICHYGQLQIDESIGLGKDIYFSPWFRANPRLRQYFVMVILRSQKPLALSAAKLGAMSLPTYLSVLSSAYSYFTLLLKMKA